MLLRIAKGDRIPVQVTDYQLTSNGVLMTGHTPGDKLPVELLLDALDVLSITANQWPNHCREQYDAPGWKTLV